MTVAATTIRGVRVPDELWQAAERKAGTGNVSATVRALLELYVAGEVDAQLETH